MSERERWTKRERVRDRVSDRVRHTERERDREGESKRERLPTSACNAIRGYSSV